MTTTTTEMTDVALDRIVANPWQPRAGFDPEYIKELADSILAVGLLQEPLSRRAEGYFQLAFGHSRIEALKLLREREEWGPTVRLKVADLSDEDMAFIALTENQARKNLTPAEEISAWAKVLREIEGVTIQSLADRVGVDRTTMSKNLAILDLPRSVLDLVDSGAMSVRAAREFLALRNDSHCHEDQIALVVQDVSGLYYRNGRSLEVMEKPPDYRVKTVRASIRALTRGYAHYGDGAGFDEASKTWRPLFDPPNGYGGRRVSFDVAAFKAEFPHQVHVLPQGDESGGAEWTCAFREWGRWSSLASRAATEAAKKDGAAPSAPDGTRASKPAAAISVDWWKAVKRDPLVQEVVGKRLRAMQGPQDLTGEDREALGTRVRHARNDDVIQLPRAAQPEGVTLRSDYAVSPPRFDFSACATCIDGAVWVIPYNGASLACANRQKWHDRMSVGMQQWNEWREQQVALDTAADGLALIRLSRGDPMDSRGLATAMWNFVREVKPVEPLTKDHITDWDERRKHDYWPLGAENLASLTGLVLPNPPSSMQARTRWALAADEWLANAPDGCDWPLLLACIQVWQARVSLGLGEDIWGAVAAATNARVEV